MIYLKLKKKFSALLLIVYINSVFGQTSISLEEIWSGKYYPTYIHDITPMRNSTEYSTLSKNGIDKHSYNSFNKKIETIVSGDYNNYKFSPNEDYILLETQNTPIYRYSKLAKYDLYNIKNKSLESIFNNEYIQEPTFSPDGTKIAFVFENNIYYQDTSNSKITQITEDGAKNKIINGIADWVYEEELATVKYFEWSPDSKDIAFVKFNETNVKEMNIPLYGKSLYPETITFKYPKAGEENSSVSLHLYNLESKFIKKIPLNSIENYYIIKIRFAPNGDLFTITSNRLQNKVDVSLASLPNWAIKKIVSESSKTWIETSKIHLGLMNNGYFILNSEKDGYNHLYLYNKNGKEIRQITKGKWEITSVYGVDSKNEKIYYQSTENSPKNRVIGVADIKTGKHNLLTPEDGTHDAEFNYDYSLFIDNFSTVNTPPTYKLRNNKGEIINTLEENSNLEYFIQSKDINPLSFITIPNGKGENLEAYIIKPKNFDSSKKYPVLMYVYGGPGYQTVNNSWNPFNYWWFQMLAQQGYIIVSADGRGSGGRGEAFKKSTYKQIGKLELEDQIAVAEWLKSQNYVDRNRVGIWGWSYGGYITSLCMTKGNGIFKMGIAVAPITNWRFYDTIYSERFLQTPQENPNGYDENSPINFAENLQGNFLIIHGTADDNVHLQNTLEMVNALTENGKQFDMAIYTDKNHGIYGGLTRYQLYQKMTNYILNNL